MFHSEKEVTEAVDILDRLNIPYDFQIRLKN
jgi:hypothetical protein